jgi:hypothetical protein
MQPQLTLIFMAAGIQFVEATYLPRFKTFFPFAPDALMVIFPLCYN